MKLSMTPPFLHFKNPEKPNKNNESMGPVQEFELSSQEKAELETSGGGVDAVIGYFLAGSGLVGMTMLSNPAHAADNLFSNEDMSKAKVTFVEKMKTAPAENINSESELIKYAENLKVSRVEEGRGGVQVDVKEFKLGQHFVSVGYARGKACSVMVRKELQDTLVKGETRSAKNFIYLYDGYNGAPLDGFIDHTEIARGEKSFSLVSHADEGTKHEIFKKMGETDFKRASADGLVDLPGNKRDHDKSLRMYIENQTYFNTVLKIAGTHAEKGNQMIAAEISRKALDKAPIQSVSIEQQAKLNAQASQNTTRFGIADNTQK